MCFEVCDFGKNEYVFNENEYPTHIYVVAKGLVKESSSDCNEKRIVYKKGDIFGADELFSMKLRQKYAKVISKESTILRLSIVLFLDCLCR